MFVSAIVFRVVADVWKKGAWDFQSVKSGSSGSCRLFLHFLEKITTQKCLGKCLTVPDILLPDIRGLLSMYADFIASRISYSVLRCSFEWYRLECCQRTSSLRKTTTISTLKGSFQKLATHVQLLVNLYRERKKSASSKPTRICTAPFE